MKSRLFEVPLELMVQFAGIIEENEFDTSVEGVNEYDEIRLTVEFNDGQREVIDEMYDLIDGFHEQQDEEEDEGEDDDDDE